MQKIRIELVLDTEQDLHKIYTNIRNRYLGTLADYQHDNINCFGDADWLTVQVFPEDLREPARVQNALRDIWNYLQKELM